MSSRKTTYIPPATTFILGRNPTLQRPANGDKNSANHHWNTVRETLRKGNGFSVPDERLFEERPKSQKQDKKKRYSNANPVDTTKNSARRRQSQNGEVKDDGESANSARRQSSRRNETQDNKALTNPAQRKSLRKNGLPTQPDEMMKISQQQSHFSAPDRVYDGTEEKENYDGFSPTTIKSSAENGDLRAPALKTNRENNSEYNSDTVSDVNSEIVPMSRFGRTNSVYDPEDIRKRTESNDRFKGQRKSNRPSSYDDNRNDVGDRDAEILDDGPMYDQIKPVNEDAKLPKRKADDIENSTSDIDSDVEYSLDGSESSDDNNSLLSQHSDQDDDSETKSKKKGKLRFLKKCAPSFAKKILDTIEKRKNDCQLCLDDVAARFKKQQMEKGEPVFTSYSCENGDENKDSFKSSMKKRVSNLVGGFYSKACTGVQMISDILFEEKDPEKDGTWTGVECEQGVRCLPNCENTVEDYTLYICSHCFNEECDRHIFVSTKFLGEMYGCRAPVFITRSFENRPPHCEKMLARMNEKSRKLLLKIAGRKCDMKGGVRCNSKVKMKEEPNNQSSDIVPENNSSSTS